MEDIDRSVEAKFLKSGLNRRTENAGLAVLLRDLRCQAIGRELKREVLAAVGAVDVTIQAFDAVRTAGPAPQLTASTLGAELPTLQLLEMKTTRKPIRDARLEGFFFGVTESEWLLAQRLGDRYLFAFVVLNAQNIYGTEFFVLLTFEQLVARVHSKRTQFQVTLARGLVDLADPSGLGPGDLQPLAPASSD
ncbi:MAG: DUF3883 domain-containing protein [Actinomycetota bacterium]|nr:DUF3883 domain-containing protein [Actinomycetota bacterium]